jgi:Uma2 family endonuclease
MSTLTRPRRPAARPLHAPLLTADEFLSLPEGDKADLIHGRLVLAMQPSRRHELIVAFLVKLIGMYVEAQGLGEVTASKSPIRVDERNVFEPDVVFVSNERAQQVQPNGVLAGGADVAIEVVSPSSKQRDYAAKRDGYERAGVAEYWIVDPERGAAHFYRLGADGLYAEVTPPAGEVYASHALPGFRIDPSLLSSEPLPNAFELLTDLLG